MILLQDKRIQRKKRGEKLFRRVWWDVKFLLLWNGKTLMKICIWRGSRAALEIRFALLILTSHAFMMTKDVAFMTQQIMLTYASMIIYRKYVRETLRTTVYSCIIWNLSWRKRQFTLKMHVNYLIRKQLMLGVSGAIYLIAEIPSICTIPKLNVINNNKADPTVFYIKNRFMRKSNFFFVWNADENYIQCCSF